MSTQPNTEPSWEVIAELSRQVAERDVELAALSEAILKLVSYRERTGAINFQLEKADDYIRELGRLLANLPAAARDLLAQLERAEAERDLLLQAGYAEKSWQASHAELTERYSNLLNERDELFLQLAQARAADHTAILALTRRTEVERDNYKYHLDLLTDKLRHWANQIGRPMPKAHGADCIVVISAHFRQRAESAESELTQARAESDERRKNFETMLDRLICTEQEREQARAQVERLEALAEKWRRLADAGDMPSDRIIGYRDCADELKAELSEKGETK